MPTQVEKQSRQRGYRLALIAAAAVVLGAVVVVTLLQSPGSTSVSQSSETISDVGGYPNVDASNTRRAESSIDGATVSELARAWTVPITAANGFFGRYMASPVVADGVVYSQDQDSNVQEIALGSGQVLWEKSYGAPVRGPNGVTAAGGAVYGATPRDVFALDAKTGEEIWSTTLGGSDSEQISIAPGYHDGTVYVSTRPSNYEGGEAGVLWALDGETGEKKWSFDTVPDGLWGNPDVNFGGGSSYTPAFDAQGSMYASIGIPGPIPGTKRHPWGSSRPGPNLYTNSVVKLNAETGKLQWYYQLTPHSLCNWNLGPPVLLDAGGRSLVVVGSRSGVVVALDRRTGKPVWRRSVGIHNGHDNDGLVAMRGEYSKLKTPMTVYPGRYGGVPAPLSASESTVFVPVVNSATRLFGQRSLQDLKSTGGVLVALDAATGAVRWQQEFPSLPFGATTVTNDVVFASTIDGIVYAFDSDSGQRVWKAKLPAGIDAGMTASGNTLLAPAGYGEGGRVPGLLAYRLPN